MGFKDFFKRKRNGKKIAEMIEYEKKKVKAGIAFGGGGARGFGHIGAVKAFEENGIDFQYVAGTSAGSMVGALYAMGLSADEMIKRAKTLTEKDIRSSKVFFMQNKSSNIEEVMRGFVGDAVFSDCKKPFIVVCTDIKTGEEVHLQNGSIAKAVSGSCAVPGIFSPVLWQDYILQDGGLVNNIPSDVPRSMGADVVVAVDVNSTRGMGTGSDTLKVFDILSASLGIAMKATSSRGYQQTDVMITPDLQRFKASKLDGMDDMIEEGYKAALAKIDEIKKFMNLD